MAILKSQRGKSRIVELLANNSNSIVYVYENGLFSIENSILVDPDNISIYVLAKEIEKHMIEEVRKENHYDYLIIYTNCSEDIALDLYNAIHNVEKFPVTDIIITCKN